MDGANTSSSHLWPSYLKNYTSSYILYHKSCYHSLIFLHCIHDTAKFYPANNLVGRVSYSVLGKPIQVRTSYMTESDFLYDSFSDQYSVY